MSNRNDVFCGIYAEETDEEPFSPACCVSNLESLYDVSGKSALAEFLFARSNESHTRSS